MYSCPNQQKELTVAWITKEKRDTVKPGKSQHIYVRNITRASVLIVCGSGSHSYACLVGIIWFE